MRMSETTRTHTPGKQLDCDILISSLMKHVLTNRPMFHSDSEKLRSKILATKSSSSDQTWHIEKQKEVWYGLWYDIHLSLALFRYPCYWIHSIIITPLFNWKKQVIAPIGVPAVGAGGTETPPSPRPSKFCATQIFGAAREIWANQIFTKVSMFRFGNGIALINFERAYANFVVSNGSYHWYLGSSKWQRQLYISFNVCYRLIW